MQSIPWHDALLTIEQKKRVILMLTSDHPPSNVLVARIKRYVRRYKELGYTVVHVRVTEDCAPHPELAAVRLPQLRIFECGELQSKHVGLQEEDALLNLV